MEALKRLEQQHGLAISSLEEDVVDSKSSREADLEIIERALAAAHENQQKVRQLPWTIALVFLSLQYAHVRW